MISRGSVWHRWDPHIHCPGTLLNDQFSGSEKWDDYLKAIEQSDPPIRALGITDYYCTDGYEETLKHKKNSRLENLELIFPNVEMRLSVGTSAGAGINIHLLVDPSECDHLEQLHRFLSRLRFEGYGDSFACTKEDMIKLGYASNPAISDDSSAHATGANQFKINFDKFKEELSKSDWAKDNILIAVAAGSNDGTSGIQQSSFETVRREIEKAAHIIFSSHPNQRIFWLGQGKTDTADAITARYGGLKPCLHGSDAHQLDDVGSPDKNRYCWVKGNVTFDALKQACIEPEGRAYVAEQPPLGGAPSQTLDRIEITGADWLVEPIVPFNPGLVTIIGARGSGKTALADMIAAASHAFLEPANERSFLERAKPLLNGVNATAHWHGKDKSGATLNEYVLKEGYDRPRVRYLSQQFVDKLCSSEGIADELMKEIERVIFNAHNPEERGEALDFNELLEVKADRFRQDRRRQEEALGTASQELGLGREKSSRISLLKRQVSDKELLIKQQTEDRTRLVGKGSEQRAQRLEEVVQASEALRRKIRVLEARERTLLNLQDEVKHTRTTDAPQWLREAGQRFPKSGFTEVEWQIFLLDYQGDVDEAISRSLENAKSAVLRIKGSPLLTPFATEKADERAFVRHDAILCELPLAVLEQEISRLQDLVGADKQMSLKYATASAKIASEQNALEKLREALTEAEDAEKDIPRIIERREQLYRAVFDTILKEEQVLTALYKPLDDRLREAEGTLGKLSFVVERKADVDAWATAGEALLDLRKAIPFQGKGKLKKAVEENLALAWTEKGAGEVSQIMQDFRAKHDTNFLKHAPNEAGSDGRQKWNMQLAKWLYGTSHISLRYKVEYGGVEIESLSPGTRGIVLLLLYLALDKEDDRPLIIDQPEENLDPKSIHDELVELFKLAKLNRQVIMVTHNANLVVNTDADQVIVASCGASTNGSIPPITYIAGGLEDPHIRQAVVEILEGGEKAFRERAKRMRIKI